MTARIFKERRSLTQSGLAKSHRWVLEYIPQKPMYKEPLMGWNSSDDLLPTQVKLFFNNKQEAVEYATKEKLDFYILDSHKHKPEKKSYLSMYKTKS